MWKIFYNQRKVYAPIARVKTYHVNLVAKLALDDFFLTTMRVFSVENQDTLVMAKWQNGPADITPTSHRNHLPIYTLCATLEDFE